VLRADLGLTGRPFDPERDEEPPHASHSTWALVLRPTDDRTTRLIVRTRSTGSPTWFRWVTNTFVWEPAHAVMQRRQFANLRRRSEAGEPELDPVTAAR
jgi:proline iminopeptidase